MQRFPSPTAPGYQSNTEEAIRALGYVKHTKEQTKKYQKELNIFI